MTGSLLLAAHIAVLGYWLGSDLVINSEYRFVVRRSDLPLAARDAMTDHLMDVDQHVRYALVLQFGLGSIQLAQAGLSPAWLGWVAPIAMAGWLALVEATHRRRKTAAGQKLAKIDRQLRYAVAAAVLIAALAMPDWPLWLRLKLALFAGVIGCGVAIRLLLIRHFAIWGQIMANGSTPEAEGRLAATCRRACNVLLLLWAQIVVIGLLGVLRPF